MTGQILTMRILFSILAMLVLVSPTLAQYWGHYSNSRFGYEIDIPPDFVGNGESDNGDGQTFYNLAAEQGLTVWGGEMMNALEAEAGFAADALSRDGWSVTERSSTPQWATLAAMRDHRLVYQRMIALCDGRSFAAFRAEFNISDLARMDPVLSGLARSFVHQGC